MQIRKRFETMEDFKAWKRMIVHTLNVKAPYWRVRRLKNGKWDAVIQICRT